MKIDFFDLDFFSLVPTFDLDELFKIDLEFLNNVLFKNN